MQNWIRSMTTQQTKHHKTYGKVTIIEDLGRMVRVRLWTAAYLPHKGHTRELVVGKSALFNDRQSVEKPLSVQFLPLARKIAAANTSSHMDYEETLSICVMNLADAERTYDESCGSFQAYATKVMTNKLKNEWRKQARRKRTRSALADTLVSTSFRNGSPVMSDFTSTQERAHFIRDIRGAMKNLTPKQARVLEMYYLDEMTLEQIAEQHHVSLESVFYLLRRAIRNLRDQVG